MLCCGAMVTSAATYGGGAKEGGCDNVLVSVATGDPFFWD